jgi:hypothetical protein
MSFQVVDDVVNQIIASVDVRLVDENRQLLHQLIPFLVNKTSSAVGSIHLLHPNRSVEDYQSAYSPYFAVTSTLSHMTDYQLQPTELIRFHELDMHLSQASQSYTLMDVLMSINQMLQNCCVQMCVHAQFQAVRSIRKLVTQVMELNFLKPNISMDALSTYVQKWWTCGKQDRQVVVLDKSVPISLFAKLLPSEMSMTPLAQIAFVSAVSYILFDMLQAVKNRAPYQEHRPEMGSFLYVLYEDPAFLNLFAGCKIRICNASSLSKLSQYIHA